ncbi:MAG: ComF family protein [Phycisphaerae bacterium]|nr:ComF family protein [Phycisphaerae bacterium]
MAFLSLDRFFSRQSARKGFSGLLESVNHLLWPTICLGCRSRKDDLDTFLCADCWRDLMAACGGDYCPRCGRQASRYSRIDNRCGDCQDRLIAFDAIARAGVYSGALRQIILSIKFQDRGELAEPLIRILNASLGSAAFADSIDYFVPVPLHWRRRLSRGFNQSRLLAGGLVHPTATVNTDLVRIRNTPTQWSLDPAQRRRNVRGAFAVRKNHKFSGKRVCMVDDITTSNATLNECAAVLRRAGAEKVYALVAAVAMQDRDE